MCMTAKAREQGGLVYSRALGMFNLNRGGDSCNRTPACKDCYVYRSCRAYKNTALAWAPGGVDNLNWARVTSEVFEGLTRVRIASRGEALRTKADVDRVAGWIRANPATLFWIPTRAIYRDHGRKINKSHMAYIEKTLMSLPNARILASLDPFTAKHWELLEKRGWSTMFYESKDLPRGYEHKGSHPALGKTGANLHLCSKTWDLYVAENGRIVGPKGVCKDCADGCFSTHRVDVWLRNHARAPKTKELFEKILVELMIKKSVDKAS